MAAAHSQPWVEQGFTGYNQLPQAETPGGPRTVFEHFDPAARWAKAHNQRVYLGEFGAIDAADATSRENCVRLVRTEAERHGIGWAYPRPTPPARDGPGHSRAGSRQIYATRPCSCPTASLH